MPSCAECAASTLVAPNALDLVMTSSSDLGAQLSVSTSSGALRPCWLEQMVALPSATEGIENTQHLSFPFTTIPTMPQNTSKVIIGTANIVNARGYHDYGRRSIKVGDRSHYSSRTKIKARVHNENRIEVGASDGPLKDLYANVADGCMHNSADRLDAPKCHEETRKAVQEDMFSWISNGSPDEILWLTGPAGTGKSAIMGTISDALEEKGQLAASYYFSSFARSLERQSKKGFVTTLAYQVQQCDGLGGRVSSAILAAVRKDPAVFQMSLKEQMERLVLQPLRSVRGQVNTGSSPPMAIVVDGVDECGESEYGNSARSRQDDQVEVLSVLLQAVGDPAFPFRVVIASRPETWIRRFFTNIVRGTVAEIFLDEKYDPDSDIRLFLKSKFADLCRKYGINPSTWPTEDAIAKLVCDASGQFIYVATVLRFIDTPGTLPQVQLEIVLGIQPQGPSSPFGTLDALYTSILRSSPSPKSTVLWLKALNRLRRASTSLSGWTIDRLFESSAGQARILLGLPSLVYIPESDPGPIDSEEYGRKLEILPALIPDVGWNAAYAFYHKSFLDYLEDDSRCGVAFPSVDHRKVRQWVWKRFSQTLNCGGPEVPIDPALRLVFKRCLLDSIGSYKVSYTDLVTSGGGTLTSLQPSEWLAVLTEIPSGRRCDDQHIVRILFCFVHHSCHFYRPCSPGCKRWRKAILELPIGEWKPLYWSSRGFLLDRLCIKRFKA